jgi:hypothetical protein
MRIEGGACHKKERLGADEGNKLVGDGVVAFRHGGSSYHTASDQVSIAIEYSTREDVQTFGIGREQNAMQAREQPGYQRRRTARSGTHSGRNQLAKSHRLVLLNVVDIAVVLERVMLALS